MSSELVQTLWPRLEGRFEFREEIGRGGITEVYHVVDRKLSRHLALKAFRPEVTASLDSKSFTRRLGQAAQISHPNIAPIYQIDVVDDVTFLTTRYFPRGSLRQMLARRTHLDLAVAVAIGADVGSALEAVHRHGVRHDDIRPDNIFVDQGIAFLSDVGIHHALQDGRDRITATGFAVGTPAYMSPEKVRGAYADGRSDLYSLACVLFELLSGRPPFVGPSPMAIMARHVSSRAPALDSVRPDAPEDLVRALQKAMASVPDDRFADAADFVRAFTALLNVLSTRAEKESTSKGLGGLWRRLVGPKPVASDRRDLAPPRYLLEEEIGRGGMAIVHLARDVKHGSRVALKRLRPEYAASIGAERFHREIRTTASLSHPNILPVLDSGEMDGALFYTLPFVDEGSLRDRLKVTRVLPFEFASQIAHDVASALDYAHKQAKIHRDIKPENILLNEDRARIADFGIALDTTLRDEERLTSRGYSPGTPEYMSPSRLRHQRHSMG